MAKSKSEEKTVTRSFTKERTTKNTIRYAEDEHDDGEVWGTQYVQKSTFAGEEPESFTNTMTWGS